MLPTIEQIARELGKADESRRIAKRRHRYECGIRREASARRTGEAARSDRPRVEHRRQQAQGRSVCTCIGREIEIRVDSAEQEPRGGTQRSSGTGCRKKRADLESKVAEKEKRLATVLAKRDKEQAAAQKKALDGLKRQADQAAQSFNRAPSLPLRTRALTSVESSTVRDVFLSHASEDKDEIARPLADALTARGVTVWFDELDIRVGQSIRREIERGIRDARFGLLVISEHFMVKPWTQAELDALWGKKIGANDDSLLPIWHKVTYDEVQAALPLLAGLHALNTSTMSIDKIADLLAATIKPKPVSH